MTPTDPPFDVDGSYDGHTIDVGHVHVLLDDLSGCREGCPHPDHREAPTRALTVTPVDTEVGAVVVLGPDFGWPKACPLPDPTECNGEHCDCPLSGVPAVGDVLGLVEQCEQCGGRGEVDVDRGLTFPCGQCGVPDDQVTEDNCFDRGTGWRLVGTVTVDEVVPVHDVWGDADSLPESGRVLDASGTCPWLVEIVSRTDRRLRPIQQVPLPSQPSPGSVLLRVTVDRTVECGRCGGEGVGSICPASSHDSVLLGACDGSGRIPFPVRPVTADGDGPIATIREVE